MLRGRLKRVENVRGRFEGMLRWQREGGREDLGGMLRRRRGEGGGGEC